MLLASSCLPTYPNNVIPAPSFYPNSPFPPLPPILYIKMYMKKADGREHGKKKRRKRKGKRKEKRTDRLRMREGQGLPLRDGGLLHVVVCVCLVSSISLS